MAKVLRCRDLGFDCDAVIHAHSEEEILRQAKIHAQEVHNMEAITADIVAKMRSAIKEEKPQSR
jgi:predicted small metal-binding protein